MLEAVALPELAGFVQLSLCLPHPWPVVGMHMLELAARALELILDPGLGPLLPTDQPEQQGGREQDEQLALEGLGLRDSSRLAQQLQGQPVGAPDPATGQHEVDQADPDRGRDSGRPEGLQKQQMRTPTGYMRDKTTS